MCNQHVQKKEYLIMSEYRLQQVRKMKNIEIHKSMRWITSKVKSFSKMWGYVANRQDIFQKLTQTYHQMPYKI